MYLVNGNKKIWYPGIFPGHDTCMYDKAHVNHYKHNKKQEIYDTIGAALGVTGKL